MDSANNPQPQAAQRLSGSQLIIRLLERQGITHIAGIPGGANLPMYDSLVGSNIKHVLARHEQGAGFIAQGMARVTGQAQVCFASSGPGASNLITAVADANLDSVPLIAITGQVPQQMIGTDAFQEIDTFGLMLPITKHNWVVRSAEELLQVIPEAFSIALSGRPGPVSIDVPKDVQNQLIDVTEWPEPGVAIPAPDFDVQEVEAMLAKIREAHRPVLMIGGGIVYSGASALLREFAEKLDIPTVQTFMGLGILPADHRLSLGMLGMHGARYTNYILEECDMLIGLGVRFDDRATGKVEAFCPNAEIVHVDIDQSEIGKIKNPVLSILADVGEVLTIANEQLEAVERPLWQQRVEQLKEAHPLILDGSDELFRPYGAIKKVASMLDDSANISTDVGQHQMWVAQAYPINRPRQWVSSGGLGTMGFGLPAAIGIALAQPEQKSICFSGDGSIMMNIQELATAAEENLDVKIIILNNGHLGLVRQQQTLFYDKNLSSVKFQQGVNFAMTAQSMGVKGIDLGQSDDPEADLREALLEHGPCVINIPISETEMVYPMVAPGGANRDMIGGEA
ncbi:biosynthetic-type acetolactate synthase large subunit [Leucothrix mucor]|uniref:biosynthetic-type acetolactate synthase large subunit n=1 Tax=Leucothrix mucor TaxID=45248 RepID=UPI0003B78DBF|nr:biosynthetic-type acetolactate synthase large subunit [Leucothrix mucor]